jgi:hypothetical protein
VNDRFFPLLRTGSFVGGDDRSPEIDADRAPSISAAAIPRPSKIPPEGDNGDWRYGIDDLRYQRHRADLAAIATRLAILRDDYVDTSFGDS